MSHWLSEGRAEPSGTARVPSHVSTEKSFVAGFEGAHQALVGWSSGGTNCVDTTGRRRSGLE